MTKQKLLFFLLLLMGMVQRAMAQEPYAVLSDDGQAVTFYYDTQKASRNGVVEINNAENNQKTNAYGTATTAVFDASFADYRPTSTACWFHRCGNLASISGMENLNTSNVTDMSRMFRGCETLTSLDLSKFDTSNVTDMSGLFCYCESLKSLDLSNFNTTKVTNMGSMFAACEALTSLDISNFNTANVTTMEEMFAACYALMSIDVSKFNTSNVTDMNEMFFGCHALTSLSVINLNTDNVTKMYGMFEGCSALANLDLSNFNTSNVERVERMFQGCTSLTTIYADDAKWNTDNVTKGSDMFTDCTSLVGGNETAYDASHTDKEYARIDKAGLPGYLTQKDAAGIENLSTAPIQGEGAWYTLDGRHVETPVKGINIKNGRKVVVK